VRARRAAPLLLGLLLPLLGGHGCKAGRAAKVVTPPPPSAGEALRELKCQEGQSRAEPLVVDWGSDDRTDLEVAMRDGVVVAAYDCNTFRVLERCKARGGYGFAGVSRKEDVVSIAGRDELHANLPLGKVELTAVIDRGATIEVALVTVGKQRTSNYQVARTDLEGDCEGASHFVSSALVGAFAMGTGTRGEVGTVAQLFSLANVGGSSTNERKALNRDGDLQACNAANPSDPAPPPQCQSILRVELVSLVDTPPVQFSGGGGPPPPEPMLQVCPDGFVLQGSKCALAAGAKGYRCAPENAGECATQCEAGNAESCNNLAILTRNGKVGDKPDYEAAKVLFQKACDGGHVAACPQVAYGLDWKTEGKRVAELLGRACEGDDALSCRVLGDELIRGTQLAKDTGRGEQLLTRACNMSERYACGRLAWFQWQAHNQAKPALDVVKADCARGNGDSCSIVGGWLSRCEDGRPPGFVPGDVEVCEEYPNPDPGGATLAFEQSCRAGFLGACKGAADRHRRGKGVTTNMETVVELLELGCPVGWYACEELGRLYEDGDGVPADPKKALVTYGKGCDMRDKGDCFHAARVAEKLGDDALRRTRLEAGCKLDSRQSCDAWTKLLEAEGRSEDAKIIYGDVCDRMKYKPYCDAWKRLGGKLPKGWKSLEGRREPDEF
jgi:TPR repeat protein